MIGIRIKFQIDRPLGSPHPKDPNFIYRLNYGFVPNIIAGDGKALDGYVLDGEQVLQINKTYSGTCRAVIHRKNDNEDKLVVCLNSQYIVSLQEVEVKTYFQEQFFDIEIFL